jgi:glycosyltransferase involved in cell wall biosynthesis
MDFSVVVPYYNAEAYLERCIEALLAQSFPGTVEILLVDNNSVDGSAKLVSRYQGAVRALSENKQGSYAARNRGVAEARGEIIAFTDPDCVPVPEWLTRIAEAMKDPRVGIVLGDREFATVSPVLSLLSGYECEVAAYVFSHRCVDSYFAYTNNMAVRRAIVKDAGGFLELDRGADSQFLRKAVSQHGSDIVRHVPSAMVTHLEIASIGDFLRKKRIYGGVTGGNRKLGVPNALPSSTRLWLAWKAWRRSKSSLLPVIPFLLVLCAGMVEFQFERIRRWGS